MKFVWRFGARVGTCRAASPLASTPAAAEWPMNHSVRSNSIGGDERVGDKKEEETRSNQLIKHKTRIFRRPTASTINSPRFQNNNDLSQLFRMLSTVVWRQEHFAYRENRFHQSFDLVFVSSLAAFDQRRKLLKANQNGRCSRGWRKLGRKYRVSSIALRSVSRESRRHRRNALTF